MGRVRNLSQARDRRHKRLRQRLKGTAERPRLFVFRSLNHIYAQIVDDQQGATLVSASSAESEIRDGLVGLKKSERAKRVGETVAQRARDRGLDKVVFDRGGYQFHGRVQALAEGARERGLDF